MNGRFLTVVGVSLLSLVLARGALADGAFLRTDDRKKTFVWNNDPQPGDAATWSGGRDPEGYAEGDGTLIWLRTEQKSQTGSNIFGSRKVPISRYTGNMVHGKFEGAVVTVDHGRTYHATFADGQRKGLWALGPAIGKAEKVQSESPSEKRAESESAEKRPIAAKKLEKKAPEPEAPAAGPAEEKREPVKTDAHLAKTETSTGAMSADQLEEQATPSKPVTKKAALAPGAVHAIDQPGVAEKKSEKPRESSQKTKKAPKAEEPKAEPESEPPAEGPTKDIQLPPSSSSQPSTLNPQPSDTAPSQPAPPKDQSSDKPVDDSIRTLMGPPASLHTRTPPEPPPAAETSMSSAPVTSKPSAPKLNAVQVMDIADIEARTRGYDLGEYQLPKAEYNAANDTWSVSYVGRDGEKSGKRLSVVVQDKSGKAEVKK